MTYEEYKDQHQHCPSCGSDRIMQNLAMFDQDDDGSIIDNNAAWCNACTWCGKVHDLKPKHDEHRASELQ